MMKINIMIMKKTVVLSGLVLVFSCAQDRIFHTISQETVPIPPRIQGSPTNIIVFGREYDGAKVPVMYVASGGLHWYAKSGKGAGASEWDAGEYYIPQPGGAVIGLAATDDHLYALCISSIGVDTVLRRIGPADGDWQDIPVAAAGYPLIQTIYADAATGRLFAGARNGDGSDYGILYLDDPPAGPVMRLLTNETEMLSGAASRNNIHYLCTRGKGVYSVAEALLSANTPAALQLDDLDYTENADKKNRLFMGMIRLGDGSIIAVERDGGTLFEVLASGFRQIKYNNGETSATGRYATGALAVWRNVNSNNEKMFVAGIQGGLYSTTTTSSYTHGYVEFYLNSDGSFNTAGSRNDPPTITVDGLTDRYTATIGKNPINHMYQTSPEIDDRMIFFASTQTAGLWSYRERNDGLQWNAEE